MPSCNTYCLPWASLTLDLGYLFMAVPAKPATAPYLGLDIDKCLAFQQYLACIFSSYYKVISKCLVTSLERSP